MEDDDHSKRGSNDALADEGIAITPAVEQFINRMGQFFSSVGVPAIGGRIWALLLINPQPLTAEQLATTLRVSRGSISTNMRLFTQNNLIEKLMLTGDRRDYYRVPLGGLQLATQQQVYEMQQLLDIAEQGLMALAADSPARAKLTALAEYARFATDYLNKMQDAWREHRAQNRKDSR